MERDRRVLANKYLYVGPYVIRLLGLRECMDLGALGHAFAKQGLRSRRLRRRLGSLIKFWLYPARHSSDIRQETCL